MSCTLDDLTQEEFNSILFLIAEERGTREMLTHNEVYAYFAEEWANDVYRCYAENNGYDIDDM
jgi:hypothetical protein